MSFKYCRVLSRYSSTEYVLYFYHHYFRIQYNSYPKNYFQRFPIFLIIVSLITLIYFSSLKTFLTCLSILSLIFSFSFSILKRFLMSLIVVSIVSFYSFFNLKRFLTSLIMYSSSRLGPSTIICCKKN